MKAHVFLEDAGGIVTGTHDKLAAQDLLIEAWVEETGDDWLEGLRRFNLQDACLEVGRIVPAGPNHWLGYSWFWRSGYELGKPGVTRSVVWHL